MHHALRLEVDYLILATTFSFEEILKVCRLVVGNVVAGYLYPSFMLDDFDFPLRFRTSKKFGLVETKDTSPHQIDELSNPKRTITLGPMLLDDLGISPYANDNEITAPLKFNIWNMEPKKSQFCNLPSTSMTSVPCNFPECMLI